MTSVLRPPALSRSRTCGSAWELKPGTRLSSNATGRFWCAATKQCMSTPRPATCVSWEINFGTKCSNRCEGQGESEQASIHYQPRRRHLRCNPASGAPGLHAEPGAAAAGRIGCRTGIYYSSGDCPGMDVVYDRQAAQQARRL